MADKYLLKVGLDLDEAQLNAVTGKIGEEIVKMGKISSKFADNAMETAKKYNAEIAKQQKIIDDVNKQLKNEKLSDKQRSFLIGIRSQAEAEKNNYVYGNVKKKMLSQKEVDALANYSKGAQSFGDRIAKAGSAVTKGVSAFSAGLGIATTAAKMFADKIREALKKISSYANKLNPLGAFGDQGQRDLMTRYGMSGTQALGFSQSLKAMGMSESDIGRMTAEQRKTFESLNSYWNEQIGKLDPEKLERYTETMAKYQEVVAKFNMGVQATVLKLLSESPTFEKFVGKVESFLDATLEFLGSPLVQSVFDGLIDFLTTVMTILEKGMRMLSKIPGVGNSGQSSIVNNTTNNTSNNNFNIYGSNYQDNSELARQISYASQGTYRG